MFLINQYRHFESIASVSYMIEYIQDLEGSAVAYILRDAASQTVVPHITASNVELKLDWKRTLHARVTTWDSKETYKYHKPVSWHMSGESVPTRLFPRKPLHWGRKEKN